MADCYIMRQGENGNANELSVSIDGKRKADNVAAGWKILENGSCKSNGEYKIEKYDLTSYSQIYIIINDPECVFNWQNNERVPSSGQNQYLVGSPVVSGESGFYNVPEGATWICIGTKKTDTVTGIYNYHVSGIPIVNE